jgi:predicted ATPase
LARYQGVLLQISFGDKGSYLYAAFGAPVAHEDDMARSVAAAAEIHRMSRGHVAVSSTHIGISQGRMRVGVYGGPTRRTYGVLGHEANVAARLMLLAQPGQTLITSRVAIALGAGWALSDEGRHMLKGHAEPVQIFAVAQAAAAGAARFDDPRAMFGRDDEWRVIEACLHAHMAGERRHILIEGEPGLGKSTLVAACMARAEASSLSVLASAGTSIEQATPYFAWRSVFQSLLGGEAGDAPDSMLREAHRLLAGAPGMQVLLPLLSPILQIGMPDSELTAQMQSEARAGATRDLLIALLSAKAGVESPLVIAIEDAHWLDSASWAVLDDIRQRSANVMLVVAGRPVRGEAGAAASEGEGEGEGEGWLRLAADAGTRHVRLKPLDGDDMRALICRRLGVTDVPAPVIALIAARAEGNPFFGEEVALALRDAGLIRIVQGQCRLANEAGTLDALVLPETIQGVISSRVDRLPVDEQLTLKVASVIGRTFTLRLLRTIYPVHIDGSQLEQHLADLERLDVTPLDPNQPEPAYIFRHSITHEVVYSTLLFAQRRPLHRAAALSIE